LRDSIRVEGTGDDLHVVADTNYAEQVEFGTTKQVAQPYFYPTLETKRRELGKRLKDGA
jgi:hypothetical protein